MTKIHNRGNFPHIFLKFSGDDNVDEDVVIILVCLSRVVKLDYSVQGMLI